MVHVRAMDRDKLSNKVIAGKMAKHMTESDRTENMKSHIKLYPQGKILNGQKWLQQQSYFQKWKITCIIFRVKLHRRSLFMY
jgi:hypothetical protein